KALQSGRAGWRELMLMPDDYDNLALFDPLTRQLMDKIEFEHGGAEFDVRYPDGIPTSLEIEHATLGTLGGELVMYPTGHARGDDRELASLLRYKFDRLVERGVPDPEQLVDRVTHLADKSSEQVRELYAFELSSG
ncbi:MAG: hypothetical protein KDA71_14430, partial [Planctomycetales bacterium]|nr:hypothetical protein [Planctomycetales bacterium]